MAVTPKKIVIISAVSAVAIIGIGFLVTAVSKVFIPEEFFTQRIVGAGEVKNVARMVSDSLDNLQQIEAADQTGDTSRALDLVAYEQSNRQDKQNAAVRLSGSLERMARSTVDITPENARGLSVEIVSAGVAMVSRIINYNTLLDSLFEALKAKFLHTVYSGPTVKALVERINTEASAINQLNQTFNSSLADFDRQFVK